jgi:hypothetical protein
VRVLEADVFPDTSDNVSYYEGIFDSTDERTSSYQGSGFGLDNVKIVARLENVGFWYTNISVTIGAWQKITLVYDGSKATLYVNDVERANKTYSATASSVAGKNFRIGFAQNTSGTKFYFDGRLKNVYIYDRVPSAGPLPEPWQNEDIGEVSAAGSASYQDGTFSVKGSGADIGGTEDEFHYAYQLMHEGGQIVVYVLSQQQTNSYAKAGVMIRESLDADSKNALAAVSPEYGIVFQYRPETGGPSFEVPLPILYVPCWLKLVRCGDTFIGYVSEDAVDWTLIDSATVSMAEDVYVGLAVTSNSDGDLSLATFNQLEFNDILPADIDKDDEVNFEDFALFASEWLNTNCCQTDHCSGADLDMNGSVGFEDLEVFTQEW